MTKNLRKKHLQVWSILMVLLPAGIISARLATPKTISGVLLQPTAAAAYPLLVKTVAKKNYTVNIRMGKDSSFQLEWINKTVLNFPTATIYAMPADSSDISKGILLGRIEAMGIYRFAFPSGKMEFSPPPSTLLLYDFIHQQVIDTIHF